MFKKILQAIRLEAKIIEMKGVVECGKYGKHTIKRFGSLEFLPTKRYLAYLANSNESDLGVNRDDLQAFVEGIRQSLKTNDIAKVGWYNETLSFYLKAHAPERMLFKTGAILLLIDDEKPNELDPKYQELKAQLFDTDEDFRVFFLKTLYRVLRNYGVLPTDTSEEDYLNLRHTQEERIFSELTGSKSYVDYLRK
jgi:hypothetical protein